METLKKCGICKEEFHARRDRIERTKFCSRKCRNTYASKVSHERYKKKVENQTSPEKKAEMQERFEHFFAKTEGCWNWLGAKKDKLLYGTFRFRNKMYIAHRVSFTLYRGEIPEKKLVLHTCDNPSCVNPEHLKIGTHLDNQHDKRARGRCVGEKLTEQHVKEIKQLIKDGLKGGEIGRRYKVSRTTIANIRNNKQWKWVII